MASQADLADRVRAALRDAGPVNEIKMFGGLCFTLNGNMVVGASHRGLLLRVGKERHAGALARPDARPMQMSGRPMDGYIVVDPPPSDEAGLRDWIGVAVAFVRTLPPKPRKTKCPTRRRLTFAGDGAGHRETRKL